MSNRPYPPDDDAVIGYTPELSDADPWEDAVIGADGPSIPSRPRPAATIEPEDFEDDYYAEETLEPYYAAYASESPTRNPWFYAFLVTAAFIGAVVVFVIVRSIDTGGDDETPTAIAGRVFQVALVSPRDGDRIMAGQETTFAANVASSEPISRVELFIDDRPYAEGVATLAETTGTPAAATTARLYEAVVRASFTDRGDHKAMLRITAGGETRDTQPIRIVVVEAPADPRVEARVIATTSVRTGPSDLFPEVGRLQPGATVVLAARTTDGEWVLIDDDSAGDRWIRRNAVQESGDLAGLPARDVTATPPPTATPTAEAGTPTPTGGEPDFAPSDARFVAAAGGRAVLRVSIANNGADFSGPLVVEAVVSAGNLVSSQLVFDLSLRSGRVATVDFELVGPVPDRADVSIRIDPGNAIRESNEDNNSVTFTGVSAPQDPPEILIESVSVSGTTLTVVVVNLGGALPESEIAVRVSVGGAQATQTTRARLDTDGRIQFTIQAPGTGSGTVQVLIDGATAASRPVEVAGGAATPTEDPGGTATATPTTGT